MASSTAVLLAVMAAVSHAVWVIPKLDMGPTSEHACVLTHVGEIKCWGSNARGQLGIGSAVETIGGAADFDGNALQPVDLGEGRHAVAVATGGSHTCAVLDNGRAKCWGENEYSGQLGYGDEINRGTTAGQMGDNLPYIDLGSDSPVVNIWGGGRHTCALLESHELKCWGKNNRGQLGRPTQDDDYGRAAGHMGADLASVDLGGSPDGPFVSDMALGRFHTCALLTDGSMKCWGTNSMGELGYGDDQSRGAEPNTMGTALPPIDLGTGRTAVQISAGERQTCALLDNEAVVCWGNNAQGQTGRGVSNSNNYGDDPNEMGNNINSVDFGSSVKPVEIKSGQYHTCAVLDDASLKCWGGNYGGALGYGDEVHRGRDPAGLGDNLPRVDLGTNAQVQHVACARHTCAVLTDGQVKCFGRNGGGMLGIGSDRFEDKSVGERANWGDEPDEMGEFLPTVLTMVLTSTTTTLTDTGTTTTATTTTVTATTTTVTATTTATDTTDTATLTTVEPAGFISSTRSPGGGLVASHVLVALTVWARL